MSQAAVAMIESGQRKEPHPRTIRKLAEALGITPDDLWPDE